MVEVSSKLPTANNNNNNNNKGIFVFLGPAGKNGGHGGFPSACHSRLNLWPPPGEAEEVLVCFCQPLFLPSLVYQPPLVDSAFSRVHDR